MIELEAQEQHSSRNCADATTDRDDNGDDDG